MGVTPIEYRPWEGKRTENYLRFLVISLTVFRQKLKSKWVLAILIIGFILAHVFFIIFAVTVPHEKLTPEMMVGDDPPEEGNYDINGEIFVEGSMDMGGAFDLNGSISLEGRMDVDGDLIGLGTIVGDGTPLPPLTITDDGAVYVNGTVIIYGEMEIIGSLGGTGYLKGNCTIVGFGRIEERAEVGEEGPYISERQGGYLKNFFFVIFTLLLASLVCADLIAEDLGDNSFILFFSRPIKPRDYLAGKIIGALWIMGIFCFLPLIIYCLAAMGTQSGGDYGTSLRVLGATIGAGLLTTFFFIPYGILISSMTKRKSYATIGIFMSFFVLIIIGGIFQNFDKNWALIDPTRILFYSYDIIYGFSVPEGINAGLLGAILVSIIIIPLIVVYIRIYRKAVGK
ncbi:MAG: ABC transporter permease [Thermoplasmata archaeon]|nr:MAG: ABC transporter permease [Thermoplasmata archaeon]